MEHSTPYETYLKKYDDLVSAATAASQGAAGRISESARHYWGSAIFTKLCVTAVSLLLLLPRNSRVIGPFEHWDFGAVASLVRNLIECYFTFFYLCVDQVSDEEYNCRWNPFNLHDCLSRKRMFESLGSKEESVGFDEQSKELQERLLRNSHFRSLDEKKRKEFLKDKTAFLLSQDEIFGRLGEDISHFRGMYRFLAVHVHALPMSFYRMGEQDRGRGLENQVERDYICLSLEFAGHFLRRGIQDLVSLFPSAKENMTEDLQKVVFESKGE
jgi:hypothetical protein